MSRMIRVGRVADPAGAEPAAELGRPSTLTLPKVGPADPVGRIVYSALRVAVSRIARCDANARRGEGEAIHRLRTTTRRLRSELLSLEELVDESWRGQIEDELKWLAGRLGEVRDLDILLARLEKAAGAKDHDGVNEADLGPLFSTLRFRRAAAARSLDEILRSDRYRGLVRALEHAAERPALLDGATQPCRSALPEVAAASWRRLKKGGRALKKSGPDQEFHEVRKRAKRARYTAELVAPIMGRRAARAAGRFIRLLTRVQDTLGEHQDAVVAAAEVERELGAQPDNAPFVRAATALLEDQRQKAHDAREAFFTVWDKLDRKKSRRWMKFSSKVNAGA